MLVGGVLVLKCCNAQSSWRKTTEAVNLEGLQGPWLHRTRCDFVTERWCCVFSVCVCVVSTYCISVSWFMNYLIFFSQCVNHKSLD